MKISREEALKAVDDIFNYCEEIDNSLPENEQSGYKMLPDIHKIRKYIIENTRPHGEWYYSCKNGWHCSICQQIVKDMPTVMGKANFDYCPNCGADMRKEGELNEID